MEGLVSQPERTLPTGTVTFLFTDIEGSTALAQNYPEALPALLARHHAILNQAITSQGGYVSQIIGDAFVAAFHTAPQGLAAALAAQRQLQEETWKPAPVRVRMGLHTGAAQAGALEERAGSYAGYLTLAHTQRVMSVGHGGQVLLSQATAALLQDTIPPQVSLIEMGEHHLKGLQQPERLFQMVAPGLRRDFPPLNTTTIIPHNLPHKLTPFIGRSKEIQAIGALLKSARLVTLTGSGGVGKTRLGIEAARRALSAYPQGIWYVELAPLSDAELVPATVVATFGLSEPQGRSLIDLLGEYLADKHCLLFLDNCEHLIEASASFAEYLLNACPDLTVLATSREALGIEGEQAFLVPSLSLPDGDSITPETFIQFESTELFVSRAQASLPGFQLTAENAPALVQICRRLDGVPLAIELAAARVKFLRLEQIAARLDDSFRLLTGGSRTALPRQQTLRATIDWSYGLLTEPERLLMRRLATFVGGWDLAAAEAVCCDDSLEQFEILDLLASLVNKSIVIAMRSPGRETRYHMLETIRQYAREKLFDSGEMAAFRRRHLAYFMEHAELAEAGVRGPEQADWLGRLEGELENLRLALEVSLVEDPEAGLRLASGLWWFWKVKGHRLEGARWLEDLINKSGNRAHTLHRGRALGRLGFLAETIRSNTQVRSWADESLDICREHHDSSGEAYAHYFAGWIAYQIHQDYPAGKAHFDAGLKLFGQLQDRWGLARIQFNLGNLAGYQGEVATQLNHLQKSLSLCREISDLRGIAQALDNLAAIIALSQGDLHRGRLLVEEALQIYRQNQLYGMMMHNAVLVLADILGWQGDFQLARQVLEELQGIARQAGESSIANELDINIGLVDCWQGELVIGVSLLDESLKMIKGSNPDLRTLYYIIPELAYAHACLGETEQAFRLLRDSQDLFDDKVFQPGIKRALGFLALLENQGQEAARYYRESLKYAEMVTSRLDSLLALEGYAWTQHCLGDPTRAAGLLAAAAEFRSRNSALVFPRDRPRYDRVIKELKIELGEDAYSDASGRGWASGFHQAITSVLEV